MESYEDIVPEIDVVIVGAGLSGLVAAFKILLKEPTLKLILIEQRQEIGGQIQTLDKNELGDKLIGANHHHIINLCTRFQLKMKKYDSLDNNLNRIWQLDYGIFSSLAKIELHRFINEMDYLCKDYKPNFIATKINFKHWGITMEQYLCKKLFFKQSRDFIRFLVRAICGVESENISLTEYLMICNGSDGISGQLNSLTNCDGKNMLCEDGLKLLCHILEKLIGSWYILLNTKIEKISHYKNCICLTTNMFYKFRCAVLVLAIPWQNIQKINFSPPLPAELVIPTFESQQMVTNFIAVYNEAFWKRSGYSGSILLHNPHMVCYEIDKNTLSGSIYHEELYEEILKSTTLNKLADLFGPEMKTPIKWMQNTFEHSILLNLSPTTPWNRIIWASTNASTCYRGFLNGSVQAGYRAAILTLLQLRPQCINWEDINEIQSAESLQKKLSMLQTFLLSINIYNSTFYMIILGTCYGTYRLVKGYALRS